MSILEVVMDGSTLEEEEEEVEVEIALIQKA